MKSNIYIYIYYKCRIKDCKSFFRLKFVGEKLYETKSHWEHNHPTNKIFIESKFPLITEEIKNSIHKLRIDGASPGFIRKSLNLTISSN